MEGNTGEDKDIGPSYKVSSRWESRDIIFMEIPVFGDQSYFEVCMLDFNFGCSCEREENVYNLEQVSLRCL